MNYRFAPPGGQTSISLGNYESSPGPQTTPVAKGVVSEVVVTPTPVKPRVKTSATVVSSATAKPASTTFQAVPSGGGLQIGVVVCEAEGLKAATVSALCKLGKWRLQRVFRNKEMLCWPQSNYRGVIFENLRPVVEVAYSLAFYVKFFRYWMAYLCQQDNYFTCLLHLMSNPCKNYVKALSRWCTRSPIHSSCRLPLNAWSRRKEWRRLLSLGFSWRNRTGAARRYRNGLGRQLTTGGIKLSPGK